MTEYNKGKTIQGSVVMSKLVVRNKNNYQDSVQLGWAFFFTIPASKYRSQLFLDLLADGLVFFLPPLLCPDLPFFCFLEALEDFTAEALIFPLAAFLANCDLDWSVIELPSCGEKVLLVSGGGR